MLLRPARAVNRRTVLRGQVAVEGQPVLDVIVTPLPLVAGNLDGQVRLAGVFHLDQRVGGGHCEPYQDHRGHHCPHNFRERAVVEVRGLVADRFTVGDDGIQHDAEHHDADQHADPEDQHMQVVDTPAERRHSDR